MRSLLPHQAARCIVWFMAGGDDLPGGAAEEIGRAAKRLPHPATVLVTTSLAERAPSARLAGCDAGPVETFRAQPAVCADWGACFGRDPLTCACGRRSRRKATYLMEQSALLKKGTNRTWPSTHGPYCRYLGVTSFDHASYRWDWYACLACGKV